MFHGKKFKKFTNIEVFIAIFSCWRFKQQNFRITFGQSFGQHHKKVRKGVSDILKIAKCMRFLFLNVSFVGLHLLILFSEDISILCCNLMLT